MTSGTSFELHGRLASAILSGKTFFVGDQFQQASREPLMDFLENCLAPFLLDPDVECHAVPEFIGLDAKGTMSVPMLDGALEEVVSERLPFRSAWIETSLPSPLDIRLHMGCMMLGFEPGRLTATPMIGYRDNLILPGVAYLLDGFGGTAAPTVSVCDLLGRGDDVLHRPEIELYELVVYHLLERHHRASRPARGSAGRAYPDCNLTIH